MIFGAAAAGLAIVSGLAISKNLRGLEVAARPGVIICLLAWLYSSTGLSGSALMFGIGLVFSLIGDALLHQPERFFIHGLAAFCLVQLAYIAGFNSPPSPVSAWTFLVAALIGLSAARLLRRILGAMREKGQHKLVAPVAIYGGLITLMLLSAFLKLSDLAWAAGAALLAGLGAAVFYLSDLVLGWNRFVVPIPSGHLLNVALYHLGQILLIAGVIASAN